MTPTDLIKDIEELRFYVKINAATPWSSILPYLHTAWAQYFTFYFSVDFFDQEAAKTDGYKHLLASALGPLAVAVGIDELSVSIGDSGITVQNDTGKRSPATDTKIANAKRNLLNRGHMALSKAIEIAMSSDDFDLSTCKKIQDLKTLLIPDLDNFQYYVSLDSNYVSYFHLVPLLRGVQDELYKPIGQTLMLQLIQGSELTGARYLLWKACRAYIVYKAAYLHTAAMTRKQRARPFLTEWVPIVRPLYEDVDNEGNWYATKAADAMAEIESILEQYYEELGIRQRSYADDFNRPCKRIFNLFG